MANSLSAAVKKSAGLEESASGLLVEKNAAPSTPSGETKAPSKARIDMEAETKLALMKAESAFMAIDLADERRPRKGSIEELKKRLDRQNENLS